jgi:Tfp pilus assembly protein PilV
MDTARTSEGFSTLEILIAMTVLVLSFSAVALMVFGNQSLLIDGHTNAEAVTKAQAMLEEAQALARKDFHLVNATTTTDGIYQKTISVETLPGYFTKKVSATVSWSAEYLRAQSVTLSALVTNFEHAVGGNTCDSVLTGDWKNPDITTKDFDVLVADAASIHPISDVDAYQKKLYVSTRSASLSSKPVFFVFDISNPTSPVLRGTLDTAPAVATGINAIAVATSSAQHYAYVANAYDPNFANCSAGPSCAQLQVIDISNPVTPVVVRNFKLSSSTPPYVSGNSVAGSGQAIGKSIFYQNGYVYLGLSVTESGPEFHIVDVHNPTNPRWVGSWPAPGVSSGFAVNGITVRGSYAYLATANGAKDIVVLDVSNPASPVEVASYDASGGNHGKAVALLGDRAFLGRTFGGNEFAILNVATPSSPLLIGSGDAGVTASSVVNDVLVRDYLAFLSTTAGELQIWDVRNPAAPAVWTSNKTLAANEPALTLDCEGNYIFAGSAGSSGAGWLSIISAD